MTPDRWRQIEQLYTAALERAADERPSFLARACAGDEALRREVQALVASHDEAGTFLSSPAWEVGARAPIENNFVAQADRTVVNVDDQSIVTAKAAYIDAFNV